MTSTAAFGYSFLLRRNIFAVTYAKDQGLIKLSHLSKSLKLKEQLVSLDRIVPVLKQGKNLKIQVKDEKYGEHLIHSLFLNRRGNYLNRKCLENIVKGLETPKKASEKVSVQFKSIPDIQKLSSQK